MKIKEMPYFNTPGARLKRKGVFSLSDAELLAIVLGRGDKNENAIDMANRVLASHNLDKLADCSLQELESEFRNRVKAMKMTAMFEIFRRTNRLMKNGYRPKIQSAEDVYNYFADELHDKKKEHFYALFLDTKNRIIGEELVSIGTLNASLIHAREVFKPAIKASANAIILVHNHPSGECKPSKRDKEVTSRLKRVGDIVGIKVLDHIIVGKNVFISVKDQCI